MKDYEGARWQYRKYLDLISEGANVPDALFKLAISYQKLGRIAEAIDTYEWLLNKFPSNPNRDEAYLELGRILLEKKEYKRAKDALTKSIESTDKNMKAKSHYYLGEVFEGVQQEDEALVQYMLIHYLYPENTNLNINALFRAANLYEKQKKIDEAGIVFKKLLALSGVPKDIEDRSKASLKKIEEIQAERAREEKAREEKAKEEKAKEEKEIEERAKEEKAREEEKPTILNEAKEKAPNMSP
jgi:tetratricopeptide (TPR) repeat protein